MEPPNFIDSKFRLAILAAKRAKQLVNGAKKKIDMHAENPLTIAMEEIKRGLINFHLFTEEEFALAHPEALIQSFDSNEDISLDDDEDEIVLDDESDLDDFMENSSEESDFLENESD